MASLVALRGDPERELREVGDDGLVETRVAEAPFVLLATVRFDQAWDSSRPRPWTSA
jgi:hypothetical protein